MKNFLLIFLVTCFISCSGFSKLEDSRSYFPSGVERPPIEFSFGVIDPDYLYTLSADAYCTLFNGKLPDGWSYGGCYVSKLNLIVLPHDDGSQKFKDMKIHEEAHVRGWVHTSLPHPPGDSH